MTIYNSWGSGIIDHAVGEMKLVLAKLSRIFALNPQLELPEPGYIQGIPYELSLSPTNFGSSIEHGVRELLSLFPFEKNVFIMMPFSSDNPGSMVKLKILFESIEKTLQRCYGLNVLRADFRDFSKSGWLWDNVCVYMLSSKFGIAVLESFSAKEFNPNVAMEFGFMKALGRELLLLKDKNFTEVKADILGRLSVPFSFLFSKPCHSTIHRLCHNYYK